jgi:hydrogenase/urease accessory protein HupE
MIARLFTCAVALVGAPAEAHAHLVNTRLGDFYGGMLHPLTGLEDVLPWFALAILVGLQGPRAARWLVAMFPLGLLIGGGLSLAGPALPFVPGVAIALTAAIGIAVAAAVALPLSAVIALGTAVALASGYQNGQATSGATDQALFIGGVTTIGYAFMTLATGVAIAFLDGPGGWRQVALRASGSWVAAVAIMTVGLQIFRPTI